MSDSIIVIKKGREKPVIQQHPWIFSGAIEAVRGSPAPGDIVAVTDHRGAFLARGYWNPKSQIQVRILTWQDEPITDGWWRDRFRRAIQARALANWRQRHQANPYGWRVINAENDYLPGLIVDRYGDFLALQALTLHIDQQKNHIVSGLVDTFAELQMPVKGVYERSDVDVRGKEGLKSEKGRLWGEEPPQTIPMTLEKLIRLVDVRNGHKTGYYLDQLQNQDFLAEFLNIAGLTDAGSQLLNLFSYTGGFGLATRTRVTNVDSSRDILELAEETYALNDRPADEIAFIQADVFDYLHDQAAKRAVYDVIVCDPPKFAHNAGQVERAARGYKDLNLNCFRLVKPGGYLMTFSCSGAVSADLFQKIVFGALADSGRQAQIIRHLTQAEDHPIALTFPEGAYLKGLLLRVY
jgi:23S rRNA (cytosine1962-C5)-methyltransferase